MIGVNHVSVQFSGVPLFDRITFMINPRDRIGLVGKNGSGKTTLMNVVSGRMNPDEGSVTRPAGLTLGFLEQEMILAGKGTVWEETLTAFSEALELEKEIHRLTEVISGSEDYHSEAYLKLITQLNEASERFHLIGGHAREASVEKVLGGLGFEPDDFHRPLREFSTGWQMRVELAKILLRKPRLLLLDEPTNHLDIESIQWMEGFLQNYPGAVILVSHDRAFLDNVTDRTIEISLGAIHDYRMPYSGYVRQRQEELEQQEAAAGNQQRQIAQIERFIERFRYKNTKARQVQSRIRLLEKMERLEVEEVDHSAIRFQFPPAPHSGKVVVEAHRLSKSFGSFPVLRDLEFNIAKGDFVAFVGRNGMGKTTLSRMIIGELDFTGTLKLGHQVVIGYFAQNQAELLDPDKTVFQTIDEVAVGEIRPKIRNILGSFLFSGDAVDKKVKVLSGGEKARLALARLLLTPCNLLVLDEPTNHLDMASKDILKNALLQYTGTVILVSHDRDFLQGLTEKVFEFRNHTVRQYLGDIYDFLSSRRLQTLSELEKKSAEARPEPRPGNENPGKSAYGRRKELNREIRKLASLVEQREAGIAALEKEIGRINHLLTHPELHPEAVSDAATFTRYQQLQEELDAGMQEWEELHGRLEEMERLANAIEP